MTSPDCRQMPTVSFSVDLCVPSSRRGVRSYVADVSSGAARQIAGVEVGPPLR